jgi:dsDNA-specific endonuclease/ATPase MutS2
VQRLTAAHCCCCCCCCRISALRAEADGRSLLLLDELGTGTDPVEGAALGQALLKQLIKGRYTSS